MELKMTGEAESWIWICIATGVAIGWLIYMMRKKQKEEEEMESGVPRGSSGWPVIGETLDFIASGYTSRPVTFMEKRKSLGVKGGDSSTMAVVGCSGSPELEQWRRRADGVEIAFEVLVKLILSVGPGEEFNLLKKEFEEFTKGLICLPIKFPGTTLYKSLKAKERLSSMVGKMVGERKLSMEKREEKWLPNDAIDVLLGNADGAKQPLPSDFISGNLIEMMIPGEETVPTAITLAVKFLSDNPVALARLLEENLELKQQKISCCEDYSWTDYMSLPFTQNVISETLRLANIINAVWRKALKDVKIKGHLIPKGWCVLASFTSVHMDEENYENPYNFDPSRWEKVGLAVTSSTFTPFGGGQRLCPGLELSRLEISIFLHHLVTTYRWVAEKDEIVYFPTVKMKNKLPINIMPIEQNPLIQTKQN
ncbi:hypothetical protein RND71_033224 [Anisodus tanguticus]|uniref:3-epi-6-deoxocathasterone 23-monooxygenase n=1 Tax=Anisodus tanguticus TaxID=243964 RepID=A0AAE1V3R8_9SOLA|nr:hypothetical protein RND71_033224 [Anisodus tanguticus]